MGGGGYLPWCFMCMWGIYPGVLCVCGVFNLVFYVYVGYLPWCFMCMGGIYPGVLCVCGVFTLVFYVYVGYLP